MILGIDATNISSGGGLNHLKSLLENVDIDDLNFNKVIIWGSSQTLTQLINVNWLEKRSNKFLNKGLLFRSLWKTLFLKKALTNCECDILFAPGGSYLGGFHPVVTMSRNMLPFEWKEFRRFGFSLLFFKMFLLRVVQTLTYKRADGIIFLTMYAHSTVLSKVGTVKARTEIIPHGINRYFFSSCENRGFVNTGDNVIKILYVSIIDMYKHQWNVVRAINELRKQGYKVSIEFVGPANPKAFTKLKKVIAELDPENIFSIYSGNMPNIKLSQKYAESDICLFASTCENMPNILLEGMASGLPVACSSKQPMPEILKDSGVYFDPESIDEIVEALKKLLDSTELAQKLALKSRSLANNYSWKKTAKSTFQFIHDVSAQYKKQI